MFTIQEIIPADCITTMNAMDANIIDVIVTSPPYNLGIEYGEYNDKLPKDAYLAWMLDVFTAMKRVLKPDGSVFLNVGASCVEPWISVDVANQARKVFILQNHITWVKSITIDENSHGHFKPINSKRFINHTHEDIWHFTKTGKVELDRLAIGVPYVHESNLTRWKGSTGKNLRCQGNCWYIPYETITSKEQKGKHPAIYPVALVENCIKLHGIKPNILVYDPFLGSGTTLVAAKRLGISGFGSEIDADYIDFATKRIKNS